MSLCYDGRTLDSGPFRAASKKTAEQMAAQALLDMVSQGDDGHEAVRVTDDDATRLQAANPKGRLLEWCAKAQDAAASFRAGRVARGLSHPRRAVRE